MIYRSGYKGVTGPKVRVTVIIKEMDARGIIYKASKSMSYTMDERPDIMEVARRVDRAVMGENNG